jgi:uncharacterized protein (TIGR02246 family)
VFRPVKQAKTVFVVAISDSAEAVTETDDEQAPEYRDRGDAAKGLPVVRLMSGCLLLCLMAFGLAPHAHADEAEDKAEITQRLERWASSFNANDPQGACDIFAPDLVSNVPGSLNAGRDAVCARLRSIMAGAKRRFDYVPAIHEIMIFGDMAVVSLTWTLTIQRKSKRDVNREVGMDVFQRQPNGQWSIARFIAFTIDPNVENGLPRGQTVP